MSSTGNFIELTDYKSSIHDEILDALTRNDDTIVEVCEDRAIAEMRSYLSGRYDCDSIFSATGDDRHPLILMMALDIAIFHIFCVHNPQKLSQMRKDRYDRAIEWLKAVSKGDINVEGAPTVSAEEAKENDARQRLLNDAKEQGAASVYIHPNDAGMNLIEAGGKSGSVEVYDKFVDRCNAEISKCILGNTLSTESSENGTQALGTVQKEGEDDISESDRRYILNILNYEVTDIFNALGLNTSGGKFEFEKDEDEDKEKQMRIVQGLWQMGLPIPDDYLYEKFNVEKPQKSGTALKREEPEEGPAGEEDPLQDGQEDPQQKQNEPEGEEHPEEKYTTNKRSRSLIDRLFTRWTDFFV